MKVHFGYSEDSEKPKKEIPVNKQFVWNRENWYILSLYEFKKGLVMHFCKEINMEEMKCFSEKWKEIIASYKEDDIPEELFQQAERENPSVCNDMPKMFLNGKEMESQGGNSFCYYPAGVFGEEYDLDSDTMEYIEYYHLNPGKSYIIFNWSFMWNTGWDYRKKYDLSEIEILMEAGEVRQKGTSFHLDSVEKKESFLFKNPIDNKEYTITFETRKQKKMNEKAFKQMNSISASKFRYSMYYEEIGYTITPQLSQDCYCLHTKVNGDHPILIDQQGEHGAASVSIIGEVDGPTSVFLAGKVKSSLKQRKFICPLFFEPTEIQDIEIMFRVKLKENIRICLG